jgi:hypothetical protein
MQIIKTFICKENKLVNTISNSLWESLLEILDTLLHSVDMFVDEEEVWLLGAFLNINGKNDCK